MVDGGGVVVVSAGCEYMGGTRGSGVVSSTDDMLEMSVVRGVRSVGGVGELCICLDRAWWEVWWVRGLGFGFTNPVGTGGVWDVCLCLGCGGWVGWVTWVRFWEGVFFNVYVCCESGSFV